MYLCVMLACGYISYCNPRLHHICKQVMTLHVVTILLFIVLLINNRIVSDYVYNKLQASHGYVNIYLTSSNACLHLPSSPKSVKCKDDFLLLIVLKVYMDSEGIEMWCIKHCHVKSLHYSNLNYILLAVLYNLVLSWNIASATLHYLALLANSYNMQIM